MRIQTIKHAGEAAAIYVFALLAIALILSLSGCAVYKAPHFDGPRYFNGVQENSQC